MRKRIALLCTLAGLSIPIWAHAGDTSEPVPVVASARWAIDVAGPGDLFAKADAVVLARFVDAQPGRMLGMDSERLIPFTNNRFQVVNDLKGELPRGAEILLEQTGGRTAGIVLSIDDGGPYTDGLYLLFLGRQPDTGYYFLLHPEGRYKVLRDQLTGVRESGPVSREFNGTALSAALERIRALRQQQ